MTLNKAFFISTDDDADKKKIILSIIGIYSNEDKSLTLFYKRGSI